MAKKTPVKKSRRRLKRSVRRSLSAVLMITAIGVAAIPVPENEAAPQGRAVAEDTHSVYSYNELKTGKKDVDNEDIEDAEVAAVVAAFKEGTLDKDLTKYNKDKGDKEQEDGLTVNKSLKIYNNGTEMELTWEYKYYETNGKVVLCAYNDRYPHDTVDLAPAPNIEYFKVPSEEFNNYFLNGEFSDPATKSSIKMGKDPTDIVSYTYEDYKDPSSMLVGDTKEFFDNYAKEWFDARTVLYKQYDDELTAWEKEKEEYNKKNPDGPEFDKPQPTKPVDGSEISMSAAIGNSVENRIKFFCDNCTTLKNIGKGYTLRSVRDTTNGLTGVGQFAYVAYGGTAEAPGAINVDDYLVIQQGSTVSAIGKHAFYDIGNVKNIILPIGVHYIAEEAFTHCNSVVDIQIENVKQIGNRAFQNCNKLSRITMGNGVTEIGVECFENCSSLTSIVFSTNTEKIGAGAFANCGSLTELDLNNIVEACEIGPAAFYNDSAITQVKMADSKISVIGDSAFATVTGDRMTEFIFPSTIADTKKALGNRLFSGRSSLSRVVFSSNYGRNTQVTIPESMFHGCSNLAYIEFPTKKGADPNANANLTYTTGGRDTAKELFADVTNRDFYVCGPKTKSNSDVAAPREATWSAVTAYHTEPGFVPYLYYENGVEYYEICSDQYLECVKKNPDGTGTLTSCELKPGASAPAGGTLTIPDQVGDTQIVAIDTNCFSDTDLTKSVKKVVINDNIKTIAASTFENIDGKWNRLEEAVIGSSVESLGDRTFYDCKELEDITFNTPINNDYTKLNFPDSALQTNASKMTIHGDIKEGYRPFEYAVNPNTYATNAAEGIRVCYQSRWDSPESKHMTVMYGESDFEAGNGSQGYVTLLDYPHYSELEDIDGPAGAELQQHCRDREQQFYEKYAVEKYDGLRTAFAKKWRESGSETDAYNDPTYGPWVNNEFCGSIDSWLTADAGSPNGENVSSFDWLFRPLTVQAQVGEPKPYFEQYPFNFLNNYKEYNGNESLIPMLDETGELMDYKGWNDFEKQMIQSVENIVVPEGVESIDVNGFYEKNRLNYNTYMRGHNEYIGTALEDGTVPGLFSGKMKDFDHDSESEYEAEYEKEEKGNDRIKSVTLTSVLYLPEYAFDNCERLTSVILGNALEDAGKLPFRDCCNLVNLTGNEKFPAENGILYEKQDGEQEEYEIIECLVARGTEAPITDKTVSSLTDSKLPYVSSIAASAFENCDKVSMIDLSSATMLKTIPEGTFKDSDNLQNVILPASVNDIQDNAFDGVCSRSALDPRFTVEIPGSEVSITDKAFGDDKDRVLVRTYEDTAAYRYAKYYAKEGMEVETYPASESSYSVIFMDYDGTQLGNTQYVVNDYAVVPDTAELEKTDHRPGYRFTGEWIGTNGQDIKTKISQNCIFFAQYESDGTMVNGKYVVEFLDGIDGRRLSGRYSNDDDGKYYVEAGSSFMSNGWEVPPYYVHDGYVFKEWSNGWTENTVINSNMTIIALYSAQPTSGSSTNTPGGVTNPSNNSGNTNNNSSNRSTSTSATTSSTSSSSTSTTSTTSGSGSTVGTYTVTVQNGSGSGTYDVGSTVVITANEPAAGMTFQKWTTESTGVVLASVSLPATTFTMPANNVTVTANYVAAAAPVANTGSNAVNTNNNDSGSTRVDITKQGISNKDLASANVNGSTDNFVIKITETDEATNAVREALTNKYGSLDNILYYAMDISLYDSTGTVKLTDTSGITVDITIPIPDALVTYGGNNMAGAVINGNQLENLNENFTTINGVPCIRFTATHFSPYTVYVDTGNLTEGMLDTTPKTGDPIHPKWFLSIGLACLSVILFMKKDKGAKVKTA